MIDSLAERLAINFTSIVTRNEIDPADASKRPSYRMEPKAAAVSSYELWDDIPVLPEPETNFEWQLYVIGHYT